MSKVLRQCTRPSKKKKKRPTTSQMSTTFSSSFHQGTAPPKLGFSDMDLLSCKSIYTSAPKTIFLVPGSNKEQNSSRNLHDSINSSIQPPVDRQSRDRIHEEGY